MQYRISAIGETMRTDASCAHNLFVVSEIQAKVDFFRIGNHMKMTMTATEEIKQVYKQLPPEKWREFAYFSANIQHILGVEFGSHHLKGYQKLKRYTAQQALLDLRSGLPDHIPNNRLKEVIQGKAALFVSFHYGSYRTLPLRILREGRSVCVLLSQDVYSKYKAYYSDLLAKNDNAHEPGKLYLLPVEDPSLFFKLRRLVASDTHVFVYADGGNGTFTLPAKERLQQVQLVQASLHVRSGYLDFAYLLGLSVQLVLDCSQTPLILHGSDASLFCYNSGKGCNRREFVYQTLIEIYNQFGRIVQNAPFLWETLLYLHRRSLPQSDVLSWKKPFRLLPFSYQRREYDLDRYTYRVYRYNL